MLKKALFALAFAVPGFASAFSIVYDNTTWTQGWYWAENPGFSSPHAEGGDQVTLGGTDRSVVRIDIMFYSLWDPGTADMTVHFYQNDGPGGSPGTPIWSSGTLIGATHAQGLQTYAFAVPNVTVPNTFTWTLELNNRAGSTGDIGPALANAPTIGSSGNFFWAKSGSTWVQTGWGGTPVANFGAKIYANPVPEPASLAVLGIGGIAAIRRRRRAK